MEGVSITQDMLGCQFVTSYKIIYGWALNDALLGLNANPFGHAAKAHVRQVFYPFKVTNGDATHIGEDIGNDDFACLTQDSVCG